MLFRLEKKQTLRAGKLEVRLAVCNIIKKNPGVPNGGEFPSYLGQKFPS